ncbi:transcriptional regulator, LytTR family [Roseovarius marisflavi]|uniref:Transcriptional regulator, LytTR family n=1 Tax=Roseovarius marisflavi TaxID=1054996 RepID=A0A1M7B2I2_9RHOB|nr:transcriptional regulator, LytTR family [Roseovarius marisflavi]
MCDKGNELNWSDFRNHLVETFSTFCSSVTLFTVAVSIAVAVIAGPFGTYETMPLVTRSAYWSMATFSALVIAYLSRATMATVFGKRRPILFDLGAGLMVSVILAPLIWGLRAWMDPVLDLHQLRLPSIALNILVIAWGIFVLRRQIGLEQPSGYRRDAREEVPISRLHRRLSDLEDVEIMRLSANDHFVEVSTDRGVETLRLRLGDAIDEMDPIEGICTHRSHWVALSAVVGVEQAGANKTFVILRNGDRVPVSRKYRPRLLEAGLLE